MDKVIKKAIKNIVIFFICTILTIFVYSLCFFNGVVLLKLNGGVGNQLFQYAAAYSLAKETGSKLYVIRPKSDRNARYKWNGYYALNEFNIPQSNILYQHKWNAWYFNILTNKTDNKIISFYQKILDVAYITEEKFFSSSERKKKLLIVEDFFESIIFFENYQESLFKQLSFKNINIAKLQSIENQISDKNSVCIHVRRGDMINNSRYTPIEYNKKAMKLINKVIDQPKWFVFSDDINLVKKELSDTENVHYISGNPIDDLYLMSKCGNLVASKSTYSFWGGLLNHNKGLIIAPYNTYPEALFKEVKTERERYTKRAYIARAYPKNWLLLDESDDNLGSVAKKYFHDQALRAKVLKNYVPREFNIYTGDHKQLDVCEGKGDFYHNLCILNNKISGNSITVVTAYYDVKSNKHREILKWASNFLHVPFNLIVYTDKDSVELIKQMRGDLPIIIIKKNIDKKVELVNDAIGLNPYQSTFFVWCDIDVFKENKYINNNFANNEFMMQDKISFAAIETFSDKNIQNTFIDDTLTKMVDSTIIGDIRAWQIYNELYNLTQHDLFNKNIKSYKEQSIMATMAMRYPEMFNLIYQDPRKGDDIFWYILHHFSNK